MSPLLCGGLGIKDMEIFNFVMLGKRVWALLQEGWRTQHASNHTTTWWENHMCKKYFPGGDFMKAKVRVYHSRVWKEMCFMKEVLRLGIKREVTNGERVSMG